MSLVANTELQINEIGYTCSFLGVSSPSPQPSITHRQDRPLLNKLQKLSSTTRLQKHTCCHGCQGRLGALLTRSAGWTIDGAMDADCSPPVAAAQTLPSPLSWEGRPKQGRGWGFPAAGYLLSARHLNLKRKVLGVISGN